MKSVIVDGSYTHTLSIPDEWEFSELKNVINLVGGNQPPKSKFLYEEEEDTVRLIQIRDYKSDQHKVFIRKSDAKRFVEPTDVMIGRYGPPIFQILRGLKGAYNVALMKAEPVLGSFDKDYLYYYLSNQDLYNYVNSASDRTAGQSGVNKEHLEKYPVPVVPLAEQQEIVRQLDIMLAQVEQIKARLDAIPTILKKFRQSVLADAVSGKLTEEWRNSNEKNSEHNFESYISDYRIQKYLEWEKESLLRKGKKIPSDEILLKKYKPTLSEEITREGLPHGWSRQLLDGLIYISARIGWKGLKAEEYTEEGPLFLSVHGLNYGKVVRLDQAFHISQERYDESPEIALKNDDILLCKDGAGIGKVGIVKGLDEPASINSSLLLIRSGEIFVPEFLYYVFKGPYIQKLVQERLTGTAIPHLFQRDIKEFLLDLPPLDEQKLIVEKVEAYFNWVEKIENTVQTAQKRVKLLTQSILAKAFSGELTAEWREQHQELITGINSAESLLAKIQAGREASKPAKKTRKKKEV